MQILLLEFLVCRPIFSLPRWHGARWSAWLRSCARQCGYNPEKVFLALKPMRNGVSPLLQGEKARLMLALDDGWHEILPDLLECLDASAGEGEFCAHKLALAGVYEYPSEKPLWKAGKRASFRQASFSESTLAEKMMRILGLNEWTLLFEGPLRLPGPSEGREEGVGKFAGPDFMTTKAGLTHLLAKIRFMEAPERQMEVNLEPDREQSRLVWEDLRYGQTRHMALGGVTGKLVCRGQLDYDTARRLLAGEYFGAGKNGRFGLGFWRIAELYKKGTRE